MKFGLLSWRAIVALEISSLCRELIEQNDAKILSSWMQSFVFVFFLAKRSCEKVVVVWIAAGADLGEMYKEWEVDCRQLF